MGMLLNYMFSSNPGKQVAPDRGLTYYILKKYTYFRSKGHLTFWILYSSPGAQG